MVPIPLGGLDGGAVYLDLDYRFSMIRFEHLLQVRIRQVASHVIRQHLMKKIREERFDLDPLTLEGEADAEMEQLLNTYFTSTYYTDLRHHLFGSLFLVQSQTPRHMLVGLQEVERLLQEFGRRRQRRTWKEKERMKKVEEEKERKQEEEMRGGGDVEMKDSDDNGPKTHKHAHTCTHSQIS